MTKTLAKGYESCLPRRNFRTACLAKTNRDSGSSELLSSSEALASSALQAAGTRKLTKSEEKAYRTQINNPGFKLTAREKAVLYGGLLTDGTLQKRGKSLRYRVSHCTANKELVDWQHEALKRLCGTTQPPNETADGASVEFYTASGFYLGETHKLFYKSLSESLEQEANKKEKLIKKITPELLADMPSDPECLAMIFCADGSVRNDSYSGKLALHCFSAEEQELFCDWLFAAHGVKAYVVRHTRASGQHYVCLPAESFGRFICIVEPVMKQIPCNIS